MRLTASNGQEYTLWEWLNIGNARGLYMRRLYLFSTPWGGLYLHNIRRPDDDDHMHDHPWSFVSFVLRGGYDEVVNATPAAPVGLRLVRRWRQWSLHRVRAEVAHRIKFVLPDTWSLILAGPRRRDWGFWVRGDLIPWRQYLKGSRSNDIPVWFGLREVAAFDDDPWESVELPGERQAGRLAIDMGAVSRMLVPGSPEPKWMGEGDTARMVVMTAYNAPIGGDVLIHWSPVLLQPGHRLSFGPPA